MQITAEIVADSISDSGVRLTTVECKYPRFILAEVNTHRVFSRNGASSRAIPFKKIAASIREEPARPLRWLLNQPGMVATHAMADGSEAAVECDKIWKEAMEAAIGFATRLDDCGVAKQYVNRIVEPYIMTRTLITSSKWANFFKLRDHPTAQPEFAELAQKILQAMAVSIPINRTIATEDDVSCWHLPYVVPELYDPGTLFEYVQQIPEDVFCGFDAVPWRQESVVPLLIMSAARCARLSYNLFDGGRPSFANDLATFTKLWTNPLHASPMEHQALVGDSYAAGPRTGNFHGWRQLRKFLPDEQAIDLVTGLDKRWVPQ